MHCVRDNSIRVDQAVIMMKETLFILGDQENNHNNDTIRYTCIYRKTAELIQSMFSEDNVVIVFKIMLVTILLSFPKMSGTTKRQKKKEDRGGVMARFFCFVLFSFFSLLFFSTDEMYYDVLSVDGDDGFTFVYYFFWKSSATSLRRTVLPWSLELGKLRSSMTSYPRKHSLRTFEKKMWTCEPWREKKWYK